MVSRQEHKRLLMKKTLLYQTSTNKNFWYCQECHEREGREHDYEEDSDSDCAPEMHTMVFALLKPGDQCFKCLKPWLTGAQDPPKRMYVHEEFCYVKNPPPYLERCAMCDLKVGKHWCSEDFESSWYYCPGKDCGDDTAHYQKTAFCKDCLLDAEEAHCPVCGQDLDNLIQRVHEQEQDTEATDDCYSFSDE